MCPAAAARGPAAARAAGGRAARQGMPGRYVPGRYAVNCCCRRSRAGGRGDVLAVVAAAGGRWCSARSRTSPRPWPCPARRAAIFHPRRRQRQRRGVSSAALAPAVISRVFVVPPVCTILMARHRRPTWPRAILRARWRSRPGLSSAPSTQLVVLVAASTGQGKHFVKALSWPLHFRHPRAASRVQRCSRRPARSLGAPLTTRRRARGARVSRPHPERAGQGRRAVVLDRADRPDSCLPPGCRPTGCAQVRLRRQAGVLEHRRPGPTASTPRDGVHRPAERPPRRQRNQDGAAFDYVVDLAAGSSYTAHNVRRNALYADDNGQSMLQINLKQGSEVRVHRGG